MRKHFTVTGFVVCEDKTLLLWHPRLKAWVPPGGHVEPDEEPAEAVLREIREESGLPARVIEEKEPLGIDYPRQLMAPHTVLLEDSAEAGEPHQHIDLIYFCEIDGPPPALRQDASFLTWVGRKQLEGHEAVLKGKDGQSAPVPEDVRLLALRALDAAGRRSTY